MKELRCELSLVASLAVLLTHFLIDVIWLTFNSDLVVFISQKILNEETAVFCFTRMEWKGEF